MAASGLFCIVFGGFTNGFKIKEKISMVYRNYILIDMKIVL